MRSHFTEGNLLFFFLRLNGKPRGADALEAARKQDLSFPGYLGENGATAPGPEQEGILMDEEKKDKKRRQLFKQIDYIEEVAKDDY